MSPFDDDDNVMTLSAVQEALAASAPHKLASDPEIALALYALRAEEQDAIDAIFPISAYVGDDEAAPMQPDEAAITDEIVEAVAEPVSLPLAPDVEVTPATQKRALEALLFAATAPMDEEVMLQHLSRGPLGQGADIPALLEALKADYAGRGIDLVCMNGRWSLRTAPDLADYLKVETTRPVKLSRAVSETLAVIAYHQPVTRTEIEAIRGVATSKGTLDYLMQLGWVRPGRRREIPGRPLTWITTPAFLDHFGLGSTRDLPGMEELRAAGLMEAQPQATYGVLPTSPEDQPLPSGMTDEDEAELDFMASAETLEEIGDAPTADAPQSVADAQEEALEPA